MKNLALALLVLSLAACSTAPLPTAQAAPASADVPASSTDMPDRLQASWVRTASDDLSLRTGRTVGIATLRELDSACRAGRLVEVIATPRVAADTAARTQCLTVWRTTAPDVARSPQVLLIDGYSLVVEGMLRHSNSTPVRQEVLARAHLKRLGLAERLR